MHKYIPNILFSLYLRPPSGNILLNARIFTEVSVLYDNILLLGSMGRGIITEIYKERAHPKCKKIGLIKISKETKRQDIKTKPSFRYIQKIERQKKLLIDFIKSFFVRHKGLEPPRTSPLDPKSSAATNYANAANISKCKGNNIILNCNHISKKYLFFRFQ